jgi:hypothetical protein
MTEGHAAFRAGRVGLHVNGSFLVGPLVRGLAYSVATDFVDEDAQRAVFVAMLDSVLINGAAPEAAVREAAAAEQRIIDAYHARG